MENIKEEVKKAQKCQNLSEPLDVCFTEPVAMLFSKLFIKLGFHPNAVTVCSAIFGIAGGTLFAFHNFYLNLIGVLCVILSIVFDTSDGQVARLTNKKSDFGRFFDGICDGIVYGAIYLGVCAHLYSDVIPFTNGVTWRHFGIIFAVVSAILYSVEARVVDYMKNTFMFLSQNKKGNELSYSKNVLTEYKNAKSFLDKIRLKSYYTYTLQEEKEFPKLQKLLASIRNNGGTPPEELSKEYTQKGSKHIRKTNILAINIRTYALFICVLLDAVVKGSYIFIFPFLFFVLEPIKIWLKHYYENLFESLNNKYYNA